MQTILQILEKAGGWRPGLYLKIDNGEFMELVFEAVGQGPCGLPALSVAHYGEQNGDAMRDPEMLFELEPDGELSPFYYRNDYVGVEQWCRCIKDETYICHTQLHAQHERFARLWDRNLRQQGFAEAFERQQQHA